MSTPFLWRDGATRNAWLVSAAIGLPMTALATGVTVKIEVPRLKTAEYHKPYVAVWLEKANQSVAGNLAIWYEIKSDDGTKYLKDLRQWWRKSGRELAMPVDGISGATRGPGEYKLAIDTADGPFAQLPSGQYQLVVEAAREDGGHELVRVPFQWPPAATAQSAARGENELGSVSIELIP